MYENCKSKGGLFEIIFFLIQPGNNLGDVYVYKFVVKGKFLSAEMDDPYPVLLKSAPCWSSS